MTKYPISFMDPHAIYHSERTDINHLHVFHAFLQHKRSVTARYVPIFFSSPTLSFPLHDGPKSITGRGLLLVARPGVCAGVRRRPGWGVSFRDCLVENFKQKDSNMFQRMFSILGGRFSLSLLISVL